MRTFSLLFPSAGPMFFLSCFSVAVGVAMLYYYGGESYRKIEKCSDLFVLGHLKLLLNIKNDLFTKATPFKLFDSLFKTYFPLCCCHSFCPQRVTHWEALVRFFTALQQDLVKVLKMLSSPTLMLESIKNEAVTALKKYPCEKNKPCNLPLCCAKLIYTLRARNCMHL